RETGSPAEGATSRPDTSINREPSLQASALLLAFFPQIQARRLDQFRAAQTPEGYFPGDWRDPFRQLGPPPVKLISPADIANEPGLLLDPALKPLPPYAISRGPQLPQKENFGTTNSYVLQLAQYALWTGDRDFLYETMPALRRVLHNQILRVDTDGLEQAASSASDGKVHPSLLISWLAALRAGQRLARTAEELAVAEAPASGFLGPVPGALAEIVADRRFAAECEAAFLRTQAGISKLLANGRLEPDTEATPLYSPEVAAVVGPDARTGTWFADQLGLGELLSAATLQALPKPTSVRSGADTTDEARLRGHTGDWNALYRLQGFRYDGIAERLTLSPQIPGTWRTLTCPVFAPTFWGKLEFKPTAHGAVLTLRIDRVIALTEALPMHKSLGSIGGARFTLRSLRVAGLPTGAQVVPSASDVHVSLGPNPVGCQVARDPSGDLILTFATPLTLLAGSRLEVVVH
ncbi:MAG TPA: hypothetical protein VKU00_14500, partial [Chthonomonadaceae bacterium]|nr:hypothetical protein [Chthonomonadaceae bacterium]